MSAQRPASPELDADDVADARYPNTARIWNYQLGGKDNFPVDRKASDAATEPEAPWFRVKPLPAYAEAQVAGCQETGMRVVIGCGGCAGSAP
jgi:hypothetical protein